MEYKKGYSAKIDERFSIHIAKDNEEELKAIINLNVEVHQDELLKSFIRRVFLDYPLRNEVLFLYIKDHEANKLVSSICLAPLEWKISGTEFPVCEMEFVGTLEEYRGRGFIKVLNELYENIMQQKGYILSVIRGIPFYYRSLGYEYVSSLDERISIPISNIPSTINKKVNIRIANNNDMFFIESKYNQYHQNFYIFNKFDQDCFKLKYMNDKYNTEVRTTYIIEEDGENKNYFSLGMSFDNQCYEVISPDLTKEQMIILLQFIKKVGNYLKDDIITLSISEKSSLYSFIKSLGGKIFPTYGWQVRIPNLKNFFLIVSKIIEERVEHSIFKGLTKNIKISDYQETIELNFNNGKIDNINVEKGYPNPLFVDLRIPGPLIFKLLLGDRTFDEINYIITDALVNNNVKTLIETIFPKKISYFESYI